MLSRVVRYCFGIALLCGPVAQAKSRLKDVAAVQGVRDNELFGYGLVIGLSGTGDTDQVFFTSQSVSGMLGRLGVRIDPKDVRSRNVAAVIVTARLPAFVKPGTRLDVQVSSMGNARSIVGGTLMFTPLSGADSEVYAVAQGSVQVGGYEVSGAGSTQLKNQTTSGRVPSGGIVERAVGVDLKGAALTLDLRRPDFTTANRVAAAIVSAIGDGAARALDAASVEVKVPEDRKDNVVGLIAQLEDIEVESDGRARVVVSERTGTVVAGDRVTLRAAVVAHGGLQVTISSRPIVSQPSAFSNSGQTVVAPVANVGAMEGTQGAVALPAASTVQDLAKSLNLLGATPRDLISILQALAAAGALDAQLEVI